MLCRTLGLPEEELQQQEVEAPPAPQQGIVMCLYRRSCEKITVLAEFDLILRRLIQELNYVLYSVCYITDDSLQCLS